MYKNIVALNSMTHRTLKVRSGVGFDFAKEMNLCVVLGQQFLEAAKLYPIVFALSGEMITPVAILGLRKNLFIGADGKWEAEIVTLVRDGYMPWIYAYLYSVANFSRIPNRVGNVVKEEN